MFSFFNPKTQDDTNETLAAEELLLDAEECLAHRNARLGPDEPQEVPGRLPHWKRNVVTDEDIALALGHKVMTRSQISTAVGGRAVTFATDRMEKAGLVEVYRSSTAQNATAKYWLSPNGRKLIE